MITGLSDRVSRLIISEGIQPQSEAEKLAYGLRKMINYVIQIIILLLIALPTAKVLDYLAYCVFYCTLRPKVGGAHAITRFGCMGTFSIIATAAVFLGYYLPTAAKPFVSAVLAVFSAIVVFVRAPVTHPNAPKREKTIAKCKLRGRILSLCQCGIILVACLFPQEAVLQYTFCGALGLFTVSIFLLIPIPDGKGGEQSEESEEVGA